MINSLITAPLVIVANSEDSWGTESNADTDDFVLKAGSVSGSWKTVVSGDSEENAKD
jgi:hypothetical protein